MQDNVQETANLAHLKRIYSLRYLAITGQVVAILSAHYLLSISLPLFELGLIVLQLTLFNGFVWLRLQQDKKVTENEIFIHLMIDVLALSLLLYFSGGASNPFIILFLFPITITVTILPVRYAWLLVVLTILAYSLLMFNYQPLPVEHGMDHSGHSGHGQHAMPESAMDSEYDLHLVGMWIAFILNALLIAYFVFGMGQTIRRQQTQLSYAREQAIRDEQLVVLGTLAASTAHELGTPLATMSLLADELEYENTENNPRITEDLLTLKTQINRCKKSLTDLSASVDASSELYDESARPVCEYIDYLIKELITTNISAEIKVICDLDEKYKLTADRTLTLALINIIENALEASSEPVEIEATVKNTMILIHITDSGPGLSEEALSMIGERPYSDKELGLGLGLYLAYSAVRRRNGEIKQMNRADTNGCLTEIKLPLFKT